MATKTTFDLGQGQTITFESPGASLGRRVWECDCCCLVILTLPQDSAAAYACPQCAAAGCAHGGEFFEKPPVPCRTAETLAPASGEMVEYEVLDPGTGIARVVLFDRARVRPDGALVPAPVMPYRPKGWVKGPDGRLVPPSAPPRLVKLSVQVRPSDAKSCPMYCQAPGTFDAVCGTCGEPEGAHGPVTYNFDGPVSLLTDADAVHRFRPEVLAAFLDALPVEVA